MILAKYIALTFVVLALSIGAKAQCPQVLIFNPNNPAHTDTSVIMQLNLHDHFCADGADNLSDQAAFEAASTFIWNRGGYCRLVIPAGNYLVGRQVYDSAGWYQYPVHVLRLEYVKHVEVAGQGMPTIRYTGGLRYGFFNPNTHAPININYEYLTYNEKIKLTAAVGDMIRIRAAQDIAVHDLVLDGNLYPGQMIIGGRDSVVASYNGIQEAYSGIYIIKSRGIKINRVTAQRFGLDGLNVEGYLESPLPRTGRIFVSDFKSDFNGRQGASFVGGDSIFVSRSQFTNTGMGEITYTGLQTGIDIEPEADNMVSEQFFFDSCLFENNRNANIAITSGAGIAKNIYFTRCKSYNMGRDGNTAPAGSTAFNNAALDIGRHRNINFTDCEFKGYLLISRNTATSVAEGYKFKRCLFSDCYQKKVSWTTGQGASTVQYCALVRQQIEHISSGLLFAPWTLDGGNRWEYLVIDSCTFDMYGRRPWINAQATPDKPSWVKNSTIYLNNMYVPGSTANTVMSDNFLTIENNRLFLYANQDFAHNGAIVVPPGNAITTWGTNTFLRWSYGSPPAVPGVCTDTTWVVCGTDTNGLRLPDTGPGADIGYQVYPNPAIENRFTLKNLDSRALHYEFLAVTGRLIVKGELTGNKTREFNFPGLSAGIYYLKLVRDRMVRVEKIVLR